MNHEALHRLLDDVKRGTLDTRDASERILEALRAAPFEDLGFARVDTHREVRQGFPEVILGVGKTPAQIAAIAGRIHDYSSCLSGVRRLTDADALIAGIEPTGFSFFKTVVRKTGKTVLKYQALAGAIHLKLRSHHALRLGPVRID